MRVKHLPVPWTPSLPSATDKTGAPSTAAALPAPVRTAALTALRTDRDPAVILDIARSGTDQAASRSFPDRPAATARLSSQDAGDGPGPAAATRAAFGAGASAGFLAQTLAQDAGGGSVSAGWRQALTAYQRVQDAGRLDYRMLDLVIE